MNKDDEAWWDALAGKPTDAGHVDAARDAASYREALLQSAKVSESRGRLDIDLQRFRAALDSEKSRRPETGGIPSGLAKWLQALTLPRMAFAVIALVVAGIVLDIAIPPSTELPGGVVYRGFEPGKRLYLEVEQPEMSQSRLAAELKALGIDATAPADPDRHGGYVVQATVQAPASAALRALLEGHGLGEFPGGTLDIAFTRKSSRP